MSNSIIFRITNAGKTAMLNAQNTSINLRLTHIAIGGGRYTTTGNETALRQEISRHPIIAGSIEQASHTLRFSATLYAHNTEISAFEMGVFTHDNILFAVASRADRPLIKIYPDIAFVANFGLSIKEFDANRITVTTDPNAPMAIILMQQHLSASDPHPQYAMRASFDNHVRQNASEHSQFTQWQQQHLSHQNPHSQYALSTDVAEQLNQLTQRVQILENRKIEPITIGGLLITTNNYADGNAVRRGEGYGTWERYGNGHALVAKAQVGNSTAPPWAFDIENTGGEYKHKLTIDEMPRHNHSVRDYNSPGGTHGNGTMHWGEGGVGDYQGDFVVGNTGGSQPHNNIQPSIIVGVWKRVPSVEDFISLTANQTRIQVGQAVTFTLKTTLPESASVNYEITGVQPNQISLLPLKGKLTITQGGQANLTVTATEDYRASGDKTLIFRIPHANKQVSVIVTDSGVNEVPTQLYKTGSYQITVQPNQTATFDMYAGGGGGGQSVYTLTGGDIDAQNGANIVLSGLTATLTAKGGGRGTKGWWGNGSHYGNGEPGKGGINVINDDDNVFEILENRPGNNGVVKPRQQKQVGATALSGAMENANRGGDGGNGVGDEAWSYGGAGGSGGHLKVRFFNQQKIAISFSLSINETARGGQQGSSGNPGSDGGFGYAIVSLV